MILNNNSWMTRPIINENTQVSELNEARGKKIANPLRAKLMGMEDIRALKGTMTPRYFATKVIRFLQKNYPELDISNLSDDDIQKAINVVAQVSRPLVQKPDVKITTRERGAAEGGLQRGDTGFETLKLNLGDNAILKSEGEVGENDLYTVVKDGLKYRVTLNKFKGQKLNLDDISQDDVVSVVVVKPSEMETVDKFAGEVELGQREKLVADYPEGEEETMDMDDVIDAVKKMSFYKNKLTADRYGRKHGISQERDLEDYELEDRRMRMQFPVDPDEEIGPEDAECAYSDEEDFDNREESNIKFSVGSVGGQHGQIMHIDKTFDSLEDACNHAGVDVQDCISGEWDDMGDGTKEYGVDEDTVIIMHVDKAEYEKSRGLSIAKAMKNERKRAGQVHSRAVADHYEDAESSLENTSLEDLSILSPEEFEMVQNFKNFNPDEWGYNSPQKFYFRKRKGGEDEEFSTSQYMSKAPVEKREEAEEVKMSQQQINQYLAVQERQRIQNLYAQQRRHTHGY